MTDYRLISLCNVIYKIITNRLKRIIDMVISPNQSAFVIGVECIYAINNKRTGKVGIAALN